MRKTLWLLCMAVILIGAVPSAAAAESRGSIQVSMDVAGLPVINGAVTLYQVGVPVEDGYRIQEGFGGGIVRTEDADSDKLAQWLAESAEEAGLTMLLDADGQAVFSDLDEGLYMLIQTERIDGFYPVYPILMTIPDGDVWNLQIQREPVPVVTELPKTGQSPVPFLGTLGIVFSSIGLLLCAAKNRKTQNSGHHPT